MFQQTRFLFLLSHIRQHFLYRIFCTVQAFCVHFAKMFCVYFARTFFIVYRKKACFDNTLFVFIIAYSSALLLPYFLHRTGVLRTFCPNVLRVFRPNTFYCLSKRRVSTTRFLFLLSYIRQHLLCRIFCTLQAFCVHFVPIYIGFPWKKRVGLRHALFIIFAVSANSDTVLLSGGNPSYLKAFFCKTFPLFVQCQIIMVREMRFFCKSTPSTFTSTTSPTFTTSNGCLTNFLAES